MEERKWYVKIIGYYGEEDRLCVIDLTKSEYDTVVRFVKADTTDDGYDRAYCDIYDIPFDTEEDAIKAIHESQTQEFDYSFDLYLHKMYDEPKEVE